MDILIPYECRKLLLNYLSAYDIAKLDLLFRFILDERERNAYLDPMRDLIGNLSEMRALLQGGMKLILLGKDVPALEERLHNIKSYWRGHDNKRKLNIFLIGSFPIYGKSLEALRRFMKFSIDGNPCGGRLFKDKLDLRRMRTQQSNGNLGKNFQFLMAFGAPTNLRKEESKGVWYRIRNTPDKFIRLRVYIPSFQDRMWEQVQVPFWETKQMSGWVTGAPSVPYANFTFFRMCNGRYCFRAYIRVIEQLQEATWTVLEMQFSFGCSQFVIIF